MGRVSPADFHTAYGFRRPNVTPLGLTSGLRSGLSLHRPPESLELRCCHAQPTLPGSIGLQESADSNHSRRNPTVLGQPARFLAPTHQKRTREPDEEVLCVQISPVLPVPRRSTYDPG